MSPKVSIVIPCFNNEGTISATLLSAINQSYVNKEIILVDNCSSDNTLAIAKSIAANSFDIKIIENIQNFGPTINWFVGSLYATGEYIKYLFSDDIMTSDSCIEQMISAFNQNTAFVYSPCYIDSLDGRVFYSTRTTPNYNFRKLLRYYCMDYDIPLTPSASIFRTATVQRILSDIIQGKAYKTKYSFDTGAGPDLLLHLLSLNKTHHLIHCLPQPCVLLKSGGFTEQKYLRVYLSYFMHKAFYSIKDHAYGLLIVLGTAEVKRLARRTIIYTLKP